MQALGVVELTGELGELAFCHPAIVHCVSPSRGVEPRFMKRPAPKPGVLLSLPLVGRMASASETCGPTC